MQMEAFEVQYTNGIERRSGVIVQPDMDFALIAAQRWAPEAFSMPWNRVTDRSRWKVVLIASDGTRREEPAQSEW
jgi:hypothetical protein